MPWSGCPLFTALILWGLGPPSWMLEQDLTWPTSGTHILGYLGRSTTLGHIGPNCGEPRRSPLDVSIEAHSLQTRSNGHSTPSSPSRHQHSFLQRISPPILSLPTLWSCFHNPDPAGGSHVLGTSPYGETVVRISLSHWRRGASSETKARGVLLSLPTEEASRSYNCSGFLPFVPPARILEL